MTEGIVPWAASVSAGRFILKRSVIEIRAPTSPRRWQSAITTFGDRAEEVAAELARNGCIVLECDFRNARVVLPPRGWTPHPQGCCKV